GAGDKRGGARPLRPTLHAPAAAAAARGDAGASGGAGRAGEPVPRPGRGAAPAAQRVQGCRPAAIRLFGTDERGVTGAVGKARTRSRELQVADAMPDAMKSENRNPKQIQKPKSQ